MPRRLGGSASHRATREDTPRLCHSDCSLRQFRNVARLLGLAGLNSVDRQDGSNTALTTQIGDTLDQFLNIRVMNIECAGVGGGVGEVVTAGAAAALGKGDVVRRPLDRPRNKLRK